MQKGSNSRCSRFRLIEWVDQARVILMGYSRGGNTTDNWVETGILPLTLIMGSTCAVGGEAGCTA